MEIKTDSGTVLSIACVCAAIVLIALVTAVYKYNVTPFKNGYSEVQRQGSPTTMWVAPTTNWNAEAK